MFDFNSFIWTLFNLFLSWCYPLKKWRLLFFLLVDTRLFRLSIRWRLQSNWWPSFFVSIFKLLLFLWWNRWRWLININILLATAHFDIVFNYFIGLNYVFDYLIGWGIFDLLFFRALSSPIVGREHKAILIIILVLFFIFDKLHSFLRWWFFHYIC